jgi:hypothetical protein
MRCNYGDLPIEIDPVTGRATLVRGGTKPRVTASQPSPPPRERKATYRSKLESAYAVYLDGLVLAGDIDGWKYEPMSFKLSSEKRFRVDFMTWGKRGVEFIETKGGWIKNRRDGVTRLHWAAREYPMFRWHLARRTEGRWEHEEIVG